MASWDGLAGQIYRQLLDEMLDGIGFVSAESESFYRNSTKAMVCRLFELSRVVDTGWLLLPDGFELWLGDWLDRWWLSEVADEPGLGLDLRSALEPIERLPDDGMTSCPQGLLRAFEIAEHALLAEVEPLSAWGNCSYVLEGKLGGEALSRLQHSRHDTLYQDDLFGIASTREKRALRFGPWREAMSILAEGDRVLFSSRSLVDVGEVRDLIRLQGGLLAELFDEMENLVFPATGELPDPVWESIAGRWDDIGRRLKNSYTIA